MPRYDTVLLDADMTLFDFERSEREALRRVNRISKERRDYYKYYTGKEWEDMANYDLPINTSALTVDEAMELVKKYLQLKGYLD